MRGNSLIQLFLGRCLLKSEGLRRLTLYEYQKRKLQVDNTSKISLKPCGSTLSFANNAEDEQETITKKSKQFKSKVQFKEKSCFEGIVAIQNISTGIVVVVGGRRWQAVAGGRRLVVGDAEQTARCNKTFAAMLMFPFNKLSNLSWMLL
ncbi:unnamed protein product [Danaus chrysippus]|uniref:(African queen) hypothetical protein n=1 Tax=Danaus chrysippus TaxID=151541 RepID=A0A8J2VTF1_9NEOP|nr:unnamed protein product [Danaus chrysippus]